MIMKINNRQIKIVGILLLYWFLLVVNVTFASKYNIANVFEWWISSSVFLVFIAAFVFTHHQNIRLVYKIVLLPASLLLHAILTILAASLLGILMYDENHIRTSGEHRAIFILASLPIFLFFMFKSTIIKRNE